MPGSFARRALLSTLFAMAAGAASAQDACMIQGVRLCDGCTVGRRISVQSGAGCRIEHRSDSAILGLKTTVFPKHGVFGTSSMALQAYVPKPGYVGSDYFEYVISFEQYGRKASTVIRNFVTVTAQRPLF